MSDHDNNKTVNRKPTLLFISNGFGEDRSGAMIANELRNIVDEHNINHPELLGAALVGSGKEYTSRNIDIIFSAKAPPSGGFTTHSVKGFFSDLFSGSLGILKKFKNALKPYDNQVDLAIIAGDVPLVWMVRRALKNTPIWFIDLPKSEYIAPHFKIEKHYLKKNVSRIFSRDDFTAKIFQREELPAEFVGNPLMDGLEPVDTKLILDPDKPVVGLLPGSRDEAYENFIMMLDIVELIGKVFPCQFIAALPDSLTDKEIANQALHHGWVYQSETTLKIPYPRLEKDQVVVILSRKVFSGVLHLSEVVIGLAGTANEQAAGLGKPVVAFKGSGPQTTTRRFREQSKLLGKALKFVDAKPKDIAAEVIYLLGDEEERKKRGVEGVEHMGSSGGCRNLAELIFEHYVRPIVNEEKQ